MKKGLLILLVLITGSALFATPITSAGGSTTADVTFNLSGGAGSQLKLIAGFTNQVEGILDTSNAPLVTEGTISDADTFAIESIVQVDGKNVGQLSDGAYIYWIIAGNNKVSVALEVPAVMKDDKDNTLPLESKIIGAMDRGSNDSATLLVKNGVVTKKTDLFKQGDTEVMNWGYSKLQFTTGDLKDAVAASYEAEIKLTVASNT